MKKLIVSEWHIINKEKEEEILNRFNEKDESVWEYLANNAGIKLDMDGNLPKNFSYEDGFKCGLPYNSGKFLAKIQDDSKFEDGIYLLEYDNEYDYPCFTLFPSEFDFPHIFWPIAWAEISEQ